jgi:hypothetical protein
MRKEVAQKWRNMLLAHYLHLPIGYAIQYYLVQGQDISILSSFAFWIHGIRGVFISVRPFSTITFVEPLRSDCSGSQHRRDRWRID